MLSGAGFCHVKRNSKQWLWFKALVPYSIPRSVAEKGHCFIDDCDDGDDDGDGYGNDDSAAASCNKNNDEIKHQSSNCPWTKNTNTFTFAQVAVDFVNRNASDSLLFILRMESRILSFESIHLLFVLHTILQCFTHSQVQQQQFHIYELEIYCTI